MSSVNSTKQEIVESWLTPTLQKENLKNYTVNLSGHSEKGDGYLSEITFVEVQGKTNSNEEKTYNFVIKSCKPSPSLRKLMPMGSIFQNEIYFYTEILPTFAKFQADKGIIEPFNNVAECYDTLILEDMEVLVFENMKKRGFRLHDRMKPMDKEHITTVLEHYGKYHALSFALRDQRPDVFEKLRTNMLNIYKIFAETVPKPEEFTTFQDIIDLARAKNDFEIVEEAISFQREMKDMNDPRDSEDPYAVIIHGDCWNNNFLFKYDDKQKPSEICFLDFQVCGLASPVCDLSYFLFTSISEEDVKNFDDLVGIYYESFCRFLKKLGSDPDKLFPFGELMNQWKKFAKCGLMLMPSILKICLSDQEEVPELTETADSGADFHQILSYTVKNIEEYERRSLPVMRLAIDRKFLNH